MAHVRDRWTVPNPNGTRPKRVPNSRWGKGLRWQARWIDKTGKERVKAFGTEDEAKAHIAKVVAGVPVAESSGLTLRAYATDWQARQLHHRANTTRGVTGDLRAHILPALGDRDIDSITRADIQDAVSAWAGSLSPGTVRLVYRRVATIMRAAVHDRLISETPCVEIRLPEVPKRRVVPLTRVQVDAIRDAMHPPLRSMVVVGAATGLRIAELCGLTTDRLTKATLTVDRQLAMDGTLTWGPPKTDAGNRTIGLSSVARRAIDAHIEAYGTGPGGLIWRTVDDRPISADAAYDSWVRARRRVPDEVGFPGEAAWHQLRHYCASLLIASGLSVRAVADWLGHEDPSITLKVYSHLWPTDTAAAVRAIDEALG